MSSISFQGYQEGKEYIHSAILSGAGTGRSGGLRCIQHKIGPQSGSAKG